MVSWIYCTTISPIRQQRSIPENPLPGNPLPPDQDWDQSQVPGFLSSSWCFLSFSSACFLFVFSCIIDKIFASIFSYFLLIYNRTKGILQLQSFCVRADALKAFTFRLAFGFIYVFFRMQQVSQYVENPNGFFQKFLQLSFFEVIWKGISMISSLTFWTVNFIVHLFRDTKASANR